MEVRALEQAMIDKYPRLIKVNINNDICIGRLKHYDSFGMVYQINVKGAHLLIPARDGEEYTSGKFKYAYQNGHNLIDRID